MRAPDTAGAYLLTIQSSTGSGKRTLPVALTVGPGVATSLSLSGGSTLTAGSAAPVAVTALDAFGNVATGYRGTVRLSSSDRAAGLPAGHTFAAGDDGAYTFAGVTLKTAGSQSITATDVSSSSVAGTEPVTVAPGAATKLALTGLQSSSTPGESQPVTVTATDAYGNIATGYRGRIQFASTDSGATLPSDYVFTGSDAGTHTFTGSVRFATAGPQTVAAVDAGSASVNGSQAVTVSDTLYVSPAGADANPGSQSEPMGTIAAALARASSFSGVDMVDVATGTYDEGSGVSLTAGVTVTGGFSATNWSGGAGTTTIVGAPQAALANGVTAALTDVTLAPTPTDDAGSSVYGLRAVDGADVTLTEVTDLTPAAHDGSDGIPGYDADASGPASAGTDSTFPSDPSADICTVPALQGFPGGGGNGGTGGSGGYGGCGEGMSGSLGGVGFGGGGAAGVPLQNGSTVSNTSGTIGRFGNDGSGGANGDDGTNGVGSATEVWQGGNGGDGTDGLAGGGGQGGGGGTGAYLADCSQIVPGTSGSCYLAGAGGAGGGGGGAGGGGGGGGHAGGGSFGVYLWDASAVIVDATITTGNGGSGGSGGDGGPGQQGGSGGAATSGGCENSSTCTPGSGGAGGTGGSGGLGGSGGGGAGGPSVGVMRLDGSTANIDGQTTIHVGSGGPGGSSQGAGGGTGISDPEY